MHLNVHGGKFHAPLQSMLDDTRHRWSWHVLRTQAPRHEMENLSRKMEPKQNENKTGERTKETKTRHTYLQILSINCSELFNM